MAYISQEPIEKKQTRRLWRVIATEKPTHIGEVLFEFLTWI